MWLPASAGVRLDVQVLVVTGLLVAVALSPSCRGTAAARTRSLARIRPGSRSGRTSSTRQAFPIPASGSYEVGGHGWGNRELQFYTEARRENARVEDGMLIIEARRERLAGQAVHVGAPEVPRRMDLRPDRSAREAAARARHVAGDLDAAGARRRTRRADGRTTARSTSWSTSASIPAIIHGIHPHARLQPRRSHAAGRADAGRRCAGRTFMSIAVDWTPQSDSRSSSTAASISRSRTSGLTNPQADWRQWPFDQGFPHPAQHRRRRQLGRPERRGRDRSGRSASRSTTCGCSS